MTDPTPLSPVAQAVLDAQAKQRCLFEWSTVNDPPCHPSDPKWNGCGTCVDRRGLAAALRAAADHIDDASDGLECQDILLQIAAELEAR